jgi:hypothetical protein
MAAVGGVTLGAILSQNIILLDYGQRLVLCNSQYYEMRKGKLQYLVYQACILYSKY